MGFKDFIKKSLGLGGKVKRDALIDLFRLGCDEHVTETQAYRLYEQESELGRNVDIIACAVSDIKPIVKDKDGKVVTNLHPYFEEFFSRPNEIDDYSEFVENMASNYLLHGNSFIYLQGNKNRPPMSIFNVPNNEINITKAQNAIQYRIDTTGILSFMNATYRLQVTGKGARNTKDAGRIIDSTNLRELYQLKGFHQQSDKFLSPSFVNSLKKDLDVIRQSKIAVVSNLKGGLSASHLINLNTNNIENFQFTKRQIEAYLSGAGNTGRPMFTKGEDVSIKEIGHNNRDNQAFENKQDAIKTTYKRFGIPVAIIDGSFQSYNNYQTALYSLYDGTILPLAQRIFDKFTIMMRDRSVLPMDHRITFDTNGINALDLRSTERVQVLSKSGIMTINELRSEIGLEETEGGDEILRPATEIPVSRDRFTDDNLNVPTKDFSEPLKKSGFSDDEIKELWHEHQETIAGR